MFPESGKSVSLGMAYAGQVEKLRKEDTQMFTTFKTIEVEGKVGIIDLPMVIGGALKNVEAKLSGLTKYLEESLEKKLV
ncbi:hypothetical protein L195_g031443 [Trifolium pratense]|uniref:Uncharacterized protein n=1 Tax=Trifolium pratense TaxID=57577 RepID=A0A2K3LAF7_TRIPR|nr:hypothetical protein L195_g031443 [Trifolium pratense]